MNDLPKAKRALPFILFVAIGAGLGTALGNVAIGAGVGFLLGIMFGGKRKQDDPPASALLSDPPRPGG